MAWKNPDQDEKVEIIGAISRAQPAFRRDSSRCIIETLELPFYPGAHLLKVTTRELPGKPLWYVRLPEKVEPLDRQAESIHHCNMDAPLVLNDKTIYPYLRFWYYFSAGARVFEARIKRSAVGYTGKVWLFEKSQFFETDLNINARGLVTPLEKIALENVPEFDAGEFSF